MLLHLIFICLESALSCECVILISASQPRLQPGFVRRSVHLWYLVVGTTVTVHLILKYFLDVYIKSNLEQPKPPIVDNNTMSVCLKVASS